MLVIGEKINGTLKKTGAAIAARLSPCCWTMTAFLPARSLINQAFLAQALAAGLDAAIIDPLDHALSNMLMTTELVLGYDRYCRNYTRAYRAGKILVGGKT